MRHSYISSCLILLGLIAGCAEVTDQVETPSCNATCGSGQVCKQDVCYDTCSINKPCLEKHKVCLNRLCTDSTVTCAPDTRRCSTDGRSVELCKDGIDYEKEKECASDEQCENGACIKNACENDTFRCKDNNVEVCKNHSFKLYSECDAPQVCVETSFQCEVPPECTGESRRCADNNVQICDNGQYVAYQTCKAGYVCSPSTFECVESADCETDALKCKDNSIYKCTDSKWKLSTKCSEDQTCENNSCVSAECADGQQRCFEAGILTYPQICRNNMYEGTACKNGEICMMNNGVAECVKNECETTYKCEDNKLLKCENNKFSEAKACSNKEVCDAAEADCKPKCGNGVVDTDAGEECDTLAFRSDLTCSSKVPNSVGELKCTLDCKIDASDCKNTCEEGKSLCDGNVYKFCRNETWTTTDCSATDEKCTPTGCYKPNVKGKWDYIQDFESLKKISTTYTTTNDFTDSEGIKWNIKARTDAKESSTDHSIDGVNSVVFKADSSTFIKFENVPKKVAKFEFDWKSWGGNNDAGTLNIIINGVTQKQDFVQNDKDVAQYTIDVNENLKTVELSLQTKSKSPGRIIIDNIRWTYQ